MGVRQPRLRPDRRRVKDAKPDFVWVGAIGLDGNLLLDAMKKIDYAPPLHFYMYPAPGPMVTVARSEERAVGDDLRGASAVHAATRRGRVRRSCINERAAKAGLPTPSVETQAAASFTAWQILEAGVTATKSLDDKVIADWLKKNRVDTIQGKLRFDGAEQLRRRPDARQAGAERQVGRGVAEGSRGAGRQAAGACRRRPSACPRRCTLPERDAARRSRSLSGVFVGALYGLLGLGLGLSWGLLRQINLAHFAFAFLAAYLCYQLATAAAWTRC